MATGARRKPLPLIAACDGGSPTAAAARRFAAEAVAGGVAEQLPPDALPAVAGARTVVAVDGCAAACCTRRLESLGLQVALPFTLDRVPPGTPAVDALARRLRRPPLRPGRRHGGSRRPPRQTWPSSRHNLDDYLLAIDELAGSVVECGAFSADAPARAVDLSRLLGVSRPAAGEMLARLEAAGLIRRAPRKEVLLTGRGRDEADRAVRRHRLLERFAVDLLGYPPAEAFVRARTLAAGFDDDAIEHVAGALGQPDRCPHGWPVDAARARVEARQLQTLTSLDRGVAAEVVAFDERDAPSLAEAAAAGIVPGARLLRREDDVLLDGRPLSMGRAAQDCVLVRAVRAGAGATLREARPT